VIYLVKQVLADSLGLGVGVAALQWKGGWHPDGDEHKGSTLATLLGVAPVPVDGGSPRRSEWPEKDLGRHLYQSGESRSLFGVRRKAKEEYTTVCRQTRGLIVCLLLGPVCSLRLRGKQIRQHRHGVDPGPYVCFEVAFGAGTLVLVHVTA
jgi:hypothetical protein